MQDKLNLIKRNTVEILTEDELVSLLKKGKPSVYCGYEVAGGLNGIHLGHLVTLSKLLDFQKAGLKVKVLLADYHTFLNKKGSLREIAKQAKEWEVGFKAFGLKAEYVLGSSFQRKPEYIDDLLKMTLTTTINRALRSMQEIARDIDNAHVSQVVYPFMQIEDIKAMSIDIAYGGLEQRKIHVLARELLPGLGYKAPVCIHTPLITSLKGPGSKMSSSIPDSLISIRDSDKDVRGKINAAYCPEGVVEDNPVLQIAKLVIFPRIDSFKVKRNEKFGGNVEFNSYDQLEHEFVKKKLHPLDLKNSVADYLIEILEPARKKLK